MKNTIKTKLIPKIINLTIKFYENFNIIEVKCWILELRNYKGLRQLLP